MLNYDYSITRRENPEENENTDQITTPHKAFIVDGVEFETFEEAVENADGKIINLMEDHTVSNALEMDVVNTSVDLAGHDLKLEGTLNDASLTINDSKNRGHMIIKNGGLQLDSSDIVINAEVTTENCDIPFNATNNSKVTLNKGMLEI